MSFFFINLHIQAQFNFSERDLTYHCTIHSFPNLQSLFVTQWNDGWDWPSDLVEWMCGGEQGRNAQCGYPGSVIWGERRSCGPEFRGAWPSVSCHMNNKEGMLVLSAKSSCPWRSCTRRHEISPLRLFHQGLFICRDTGPGSHSWSLAASGYLGMSAASCRS